jgi:hypothetical protein
MIKRRLKNLSKLGILIGTRQAYFLGRNWYLLTYQPYLTLKEIWDKRDKSQMFLITLTALTPAIVYVIARVIWDLAMYHRLLLVTGKVFIAAGVVQTIVLLYLGYWIIQVLRKEN